MFSRVIKYSRKHFSIFKKLKNISDGRLRPRILTAKVAQAIFSLQMANLGSLNNLSQSTGGALSPSVSTIARVADSMDLDNIREVGCLIYKQARAARMLSPHAKMWVGIIDAKEITTSDYCKLRPLQKKKKKYC